MEPIRREARNHTVVVNEAIVAAQDAVACAALREPRPAVHVEPIHEFGGIRAHHLDLAEGRGVENAAGIAYGEAFARDRGMQTLAVAREIARALPQRDVLEHGALPLCPSVRRRGAPRIEQIAA